MSKTIDYCPTGYDYEQYQLNELENENMKLKKQLAIVTKALEDIVKDYDRNGPCEEDCVGYYMYHIAIKALKELEGIK